ncbi:3-methyladenine DNA glycosylase [Scardovia inopinata]|uniref:DNA-3-methyladenine glycosylase I n=1 Tax=Scardovia inopinata F0304 TaxID=641146 RepID=W5IGU8_SCAIO|nr:DNA-3-methyladenine glycosylase I [Scardovia inopinata]EFG26059.1 DNA-3-methyladenine glycosylase I [Scardovia inopinata F0304]BAR07310.1 DNA glycosylase [Scardovia inopinata JCM 12537]SUV51386.1 3-methyladenine DNA glycosylase [Scardovia inopinata]
MPKRCTWAAGGNELLKHYHDREWGTPCHSDQKLFELLSLEIFQAGLSWQTVLNKRQALDDALANFDFQILSSFEGQLPKLLTNQAIIRNQRKLLAIIHNARIVSDMVMRGQSFDAYLWQFVHYQPIQHHYQSHLQIPKTNQLAIQISQTMKSAGFRFTGPVVSYSFLQAAGIINDHETTCFRYSKLSQPKK